MSDEGDVADEAVADGAEAADSRVSGGPDGPGDKPVVRKRPPASGRGRAAVEPTRCRRRRAADRGFGSYWGSRTIRTTAGRPRPPAKRP